MATKIQRELAFLLTGRDVSASKAIRGVSREVQDLNKIAAKAGSNIVRNVERGIVVGTVAMAGAIGYAVKAAQSFESASAGVAKTVDGDVAAILAGLKDMSTQAPIAYEELAGIAETAGALGVAKGDILAFTDTIAKLSVTTDLTSEGASTSLGHLKTNLNLTGDAFAHVGNTLVDLGNKGASTESQILGMAEGVSGVANIVGLSTAQVLGWGAAWANTGEEVEAGSTEMQKLFLETFKMVNEGGGDLKLLAKTAGMSAKDFATAYRQDASGAMEGFLVQLGKLSKEKQAATLEDLGFTDIRITRGLLKILGNTDNLTDSLDIANQAWDQNNAMQIEAEKRFATNAAQMKILDNNVRLAAASVGEELLPIMNELAKEGVDWLRQHQPEIKAFGKDLARNIRDAVTWARSLDWDAITSTLKAGADMAKLAVEAFMALPDPVKQGLAGAFALNKLTGGAVQDLGGLLLRTTFKSMLVNAGVVNVNGAMAGGGGPGGAGRSVASKIAFGVGTLISGAMIVEALSNAWNDPSDPLGSTIKKITGGANFADLQVAAGQNIDNTQAMIARGDLNELTNALLGLQRMPDQLNPIQRALYELNASGVKVHTESLEAALRDAAFTIATARAQSYLSTHPDKRDPATVNVNVNTSVPLRVNGWDSRTG